MVKTTKESVVKNVKLLCVLLVVTMFVGSGCSMIPTTVDEMQRPLEKPKEPSRAPFYIAIGLVVPLIYGNPYVMWAKIIAAEYGGALLAVEIMAVDYPSMTYFLKLDERRQDKYVRDLAYWILVNDLVATEGVEITTLYGHSYMNSGEFVWDTVRTWGSGYQNLEWFEEDGSLRPEWRERIGRDVIHLSDGKTELYDVAFYEAGPWKGVNLFLRDRTTEKRKRFYLWRNPHDNEGHNYADEVELKLVLRDGMN